MKTKVITIKRDDSRTVWDKVIETLEIPNKDETVAQINRIELDVISYRSYRNNKRFRMGIFNVESKS